jgi:hypothetical protein
MQISYQKIPVELKFSSDPEKYSFTWEIIAIDEIQLYYLPLIKRPIKIIIFGVSYSKERMLKS